MRTTLLTASVLALILGAGCADPVGDLAVRYAVSAGGETCSDLGIVTVQVTIQAPESDPIVGTGACAGATGVVTFTNVPVDVYAVTVEALDGIGNVTYTGSLSSVTVVEGTLTTTDSIGLRVAPPTLSIEWSFANGGMCTNPSINVDEIDIELWVRDYGLLGTFTVGCMDVQPFHIAEGLVPGQYDIKARGADATTGVYTYQFNSVEISAYQNGIPIAAGQPAGVALRLAPCVGPCPF